MSQLQCVVVTPETTVLDRMGDFVALPLFDGEIGIGPGHSPMIGRLGFGELRLRDQGSTTRYYVDGGFVQVADNVVTVLTGRAIAAEKLDSAVAREQLAAARARAAHSEEHLAIRERLVSQARAQVRVAEHAGK